MRGRNDFLGAFLKYQNLSYLWINSLKFIKFVIIVCKLEDYRNILKLACRPLDFTSYKAF